MTNAEKYLKEGINKDELFSGIANAFFGECSKCDIARLKNLPKDYKLMRTEVGNLYLTSEDSSESGIFNHLFKFIKYGEEYSIKELLGGNVDD